MVDQFVSGLPEVDERQVAAVGGKGGAHLGGLSRLDGIRVPAGYCVTTEPSDGSWRKRCRWTIGSMS